MLPLVLDPQDGWYSGKFDVFIGNSYTIMTSILLPFQVHAGPTSLEMLLQTSGALEAFLAQASRSNLVVALASCAISNNL